MFLRISIFLAGLVLLGLVLIVVSDMFVPLFLKPAVESQTAAAPPAQAKLTETNPRSPGPLPRPKPLIDSGSSITLDSPEKIPAPVTLLTPTNLSIDDEINGTLTLSWQNPAPGAQSYTIERKTSEFGQFESICTVWTGSISDTNISFPLSHWRNPWAFDSDTDYFFRVKAHAQEVESSPYSGEVKWSSPLAAPFHLTVTATDLSQVLLTWQDNSQTESGFIIERRSYFEDFRPVFTACANAISCVDTTIDFATHYIYRIKAFRLGKESAYSEERGTGDITAMYEEYEHVISECVIWVFATKTTPTHTVTIETGWPAPVISSSYNSQLQIAPQYNDFKGPIYRRPTEEMLNACKNKFLWVEWLADVEITECRLECNYIKLYGEKRDDRFDYSCWYFTWVYRIPFDGQGNQLRGGINQTQAHVPKKITLEQLKNQINQQPKPGEYNIIIQ